jgi:hypothetical protein
MPRKLSAWQDRMDERWGGITFSFQPLPWDWRLRFYHDDLDPYWKIDLGPLGIDIVANFLTSPERRAQQAMSGFLVSKVEVADFVPTTVTDWGGGGFRKPGEPGPGEPGDASDAT